MAPNKAPVVSADTSTAPEYFAQIALDVIEPSPTNPRTHFPDAYLGELAQSIREKGLVQPIVVRERPGSKSFDQRFEIVAGECRYRASKLAGLETMAAIVRPYTDEQVLEVQLIENIHRTDLTPLEQAAGYRRLIATNPTKHSAESIAQRIGMSPAWVWDRLKLNDLIAEAKVILEHEWMSVGHAILIARLKPEDQKRAIATEDGERFGRMAGGLWRHDSGFDFDEADPANKGKRRPTKYESLKTCSVRELENWIREHVRFDVQHAAKAQPLVFEQTARDVEHAAALTGRGKKVVHITHEYRVADDARDASERTYGSQSWARADGKSKSTTCEHSVLGVVVAGRGYGETLEVCVNRDKCRTHFGAAIKQRAKTAKLRATGKVDKARDAEAKADDKRRREQLEAQQRRDVWDAVSTHVIAGAVAQVKTWKSVTAKAAALLDELGIWNAGEVCRQHLGAKWYEQPVAAWLLLIVVHSNCDSFDAYVTDVARPLGLNVNHLAAIRDKHQPKPAAPAAPAGKGKRR